MSNIGGKVTNIIGGTNFGDNYQTAGVGSGWTGPIWYGIIPFWIPTKVLETFGTTITKDKRNADKSIANITEGETQLTLVGYLKGPFKRFWKELLVLIRQLQLKFSLAYRRYVLGISQWTGIISKWWVMRFPFLSPMATEPNMYIKSLMFTHGAEQLDSYEFILYLEKINASVVPTDTALKGNKIANISMALSVINTIASTGVATYFQSMATMRQNTWDNVKTTTSGANLIEIDSNKITPGVTADAKLTGNSYYPGFDTSRTWYKVFNTNNQTNSSMFHFADITKIYRLSCQVVSSTGAATPSGAHFVLNAQLEVASSDNPDTWSLQWSGRVAGNVTYSYSNLRFGFDIVNIHESWDGKQWICDQQTVEAIASVK